MYVEKDMFTQEKRQKDNILTKYEVGGRVHNKQQFMLLAQVLNEEYKLSMHYLNVDIQNNCMRLHARKSTGHAYVTKTLAA
jgi:hypothetical protein